MPRFVVAFLACLAAFGARAEAPSADAVSRHLIAESLAPVLEIVEAESLSQPIAVRGDFAELTASGLVGGYADLLLDRGYEVYELRGQQRAPEGALLLELRPRVVGIRYGRIERSFLGLGRGMQERIAELELGLKLSDADSGRLLYSDDRSLERVDWVPTGTDEALTAGHPFHTPTKSGGQQSQAAVPHVGWLERGLAVGLMSGIIIVYFSASS